MNLIAVGMVVLGILLLLWGSLLLFQHRKATGIVIALLGLGAAATPFVITFFLFG